MGIWRIVRRMLFLYVMEYIPEYIARYLRGYQSTGENLRTASAAFVYHFLRAGDLGFYLKINAKREVIGLWSEAEHMRWLEGKLDIWLDLHRPSGEDLVFLHGDYCLPNVLVEDGALTGFVDWEYAGAGDRWIDIVACAQSVQRNLGAELSEVFLKAYGVGQMDREREAYYGQLLVS